MKLPTWVWNFHFNPNPDEPEPNRKNESRKHEMTPVKQKKRFNRAGENTKKTKKSFVFSNFRVFVINPPQADHKMQSFNL
jgi:hypothetical protein